MLYHAHIIDSLDNIASVSHRSPALHNAHKAMPPYAHTVDWISGSTTLNQRDTAQSLTVLPERRCHYMNVPSALSLILPLDAVEILFDSSP